MDWKNITYRELGLSFQVWLAYTQECLASIGRIAHPVRGSWLRRNFLQYVLRSVCSLLQSRNGNLPEALAKKLGVSAVLSGHTGCVNRLAWNQDGSLLASASDDCQVQRRRRACFCQSSNIWTTKPAFANQAVIM